MHIVAFDSNSIRFSSFTQSTQYTFIEIVCLHIQFLFSLIRYHQLFLSFLATKKETNCFSSTALKMVGNSNNSKHVLFKQHPFKQQKN